jgi:hypothetical protein
VGVGYAISIKQAMNFYWQLRSGRVVDHATLGFTVSTDGRGKVTVSNILESSDAYRRGLRYGDEILRLGDRDIATTNQLKNVLGIFPAQWRVPLRYRNDSDTVETVVRLQNLHLPIELEEIVRGETAEQPKPPPRSPQDEPEDSQDSKPNEKPKRSTKVDVLADRYEAKRGFGNYYFNRLELDRILEMQKSHGDWSTANGSANATWDLTARPLGENNDIHVVLDSAAIAVRWGDKTETANAKLGWPVWIKQQSNLSMALGMRVWQQWYQVGPRKRGEAVYIGRSPVLGKKEQLDSTRITLGEVDAMVYTAPETGHIECVELSSDNQSDPAEIFFENYQSIDGRQVPTQLRLVFGLEQRIAINLRSVDWMAKSVTESDLNPSAGGSQ